jgi:hypothetical protein
MLAGASTEEDADAEPFVGSRHVFVRDSWIRGPRSLNAIRGRKGRVDHSQFTVRAKRRHKFRRRLCQL